MLDLSCKYVEPKEKRESTERFQKALKNLQEEAQRRKLRGYWDLGDIILSYKESYSSSGYRSNAVALAAEHLKDFDGYSKAVLSDCIRLRQLFEDPKEAESLSITNWTLIRALIRAITNKPGNVTRKKIISDCEEINKQFAPVIAYEIMIKPYCEWDELRAFAEKQLMKGCWGKSPAKAVAKLVKEVKLKQIDPDIFKLL